MRFMVVTTWTDLGGPNEAAVQFVEGTSAEAVLADRLEVHDDDPGPVYVVPADVVLSGSSAT